MKYWFIILLAAVLFSSCKNNDASDKKLVVQLKKQIRVLGEYKSSLMLKANQARTHSSFADTYADLAGSLDNVFRLFADTTHCIIDTSLLKTKAGKFVAAYNEIIDSALHSKTRRYKLFMDRDTSSLKMHPLLIETFYGKSTEVNYYALLEQAYCYHLGVLKVVSTAGTFAFGCNFGWQDNVGKFVTITEKENSTIVTLQALLDNHFKVVRTVSLEKKFGSKEEIGSEKTGGHIVTFETKKLSPGQYRAIVEYTGITPDGVHQIYPFEFFFSIE